MVTAPDPVELALILGRVLERLGVRYRIGGSVASSVYGEVRTTLDVAVVVELGQQHVDALVAATEADCHILDESVRRAVRDKSSFNMIHEGMLVKADVYVSPDDLLTASSSLVAAASRCAPSRDPRSNWPRPKTS